MAVNASEVTALLLEQYPNARLALEFSNPLELLVATILSAQCTDARVNAVTKELFRKYKTVQDYAQADPKIFEQAIRATGFYQSKAKRIIACCQKLVEDFNGLVPSTLEELVMLPGVGRKTANMVLGNAFGQPSIAVDTHVLRVSNRLGLVDTSNPDRVEQVLMRRIPHSQWTVVTNALILHGREVCTARKPRCKACRLLDQCQWPYKTNAP